MASSAYKALVLGAGASLAYNYPLGSDLRQRILRLDESTAREAGIIRQSNEKDDTLELTSFQLAFKRSQMYSIDAFLGRRPDFVEVGKLCIAAILLKCENSKVLFAERNDKDHWYQFLLNHFAKRDWEELTFDDIAIISFNYDRSLQTFLFVTLQDVYKKSGRDIAKKLKSLRIVHVYGSLCSPLPGSSGYLEYDGKVDIDKVDTAAKGLIVIPEGRVDGDSLKQAREWLAAAQGICFLGFGFDETNVERLAENDACVMWKQMPTGRTPRNIVGTCLGMTQREIAAAFSRLTQSSLDEAGDRRFQQTNCTQLLRETLFLR